MKSPAFTWSARCYGALLHFYPIEFRIRYGREMTQVFIDCCRKETRKTGLKGFSILWARSLADILVSTSREQLRIVLNVRDLQLRTASWIDSIVILTIISFHLLAAGTGVAFYIPRAHDNLNALVLIAGAVAAALGGVGVACSLVLARFRRIQYRLINL
jgi:hypothetical protein